MGTLLPFRAVPPAGLDCLLGLLFLLGLWSVIVSGRKHSIRLCSPRQAEAERWGVALREVIASKAPLETPTQLLLRDIQVTERGLHRERGGWWTQQLSGFMKSPLLHHFEPFPGP